MRRPAESTQPWIAVGLLLGMALAAPVRAVDGVIEINQAKAKVGGVTPGDTPLFPVTISQPGSYRLTSNLDVTDASARPNGTAAENTTAIQVTADNVTIDLNGFMIKGPTVCSGHPLTCSPTGSGLGIAAPAAAGSAVMNGTVQGMGSTGVRLHPDLGSQAEKVRAVSNGFLSISAATVTDCTAFFNGQGGISAVTATGCTAYINGGRGISAIDTVNNCTAKSNSDDGINAPVVISCTADSNGGRGISATTATGCTASSNSNDGIRARTVTNCTAFRNGSSGIAATTVNNCTADSNGGSGIVGRMVATSVAEDNGEMGIAALTVTGCTATSNGSTGILAITAT